MKINLLDWAEMFGNNGVCVDTKDATFGKIVTIDYMNESANDIAIFDDAEYYEFFRAVMKAAEIIRFYNTETPIIDWAKLSIAFGKYRNANFDENDTDAVADGITELASALAGNATKSWYKKYTPFFTNLAVQ